MRYAAVCLQKQYETRILKGQQREQTYSYIPPTQWHLWRVGARRRRCVVADIGEWIELRLLAVRTAGRVTSRH